MTNEQEIKLQGIVGSTGVCIGQAYLIEKSGVDVVKKYNIKQEGIIEETNRFREAVRMSILNFEQIIADIPKELKENAEILETYASISKDKLLYDKNNRNNRKRTYKF